MDLDDLPVYDEGDMTALRCTLGGSLVVCLCDVTAGDFITYLMGQPVALCKEHPRAAKLASMASVNKSISFRTASGQDRCLDEVINAVNREHFKQRVESLRARKMQI